jgi:hypothetical protein
MRNCIHRNTADRGRVAGAGWVVGNENPLGTVTLDGCSMTSAVTTGEAQFLAMWDGPDYKLKALNLLDCTYQESGVVTDRETYPFKVYVRCDGSPSHEPTAVTVSGMRMYYRSTRVGTANYVVRLLEMGGSNLTWVVRDSQFDAGIQNGSAASLRGLCLGDAFTTKGSGVIDRCVFKMQGAEPWAVRVGDSDRLTIDGTVDVQNSDFSGIGTTGAPVYVSRDDANNAKVRLVNNVF